MMAQSSTYTQGYSKHTVATHLLRTAESEAAFLLPHLKSTDHILDIGCGPGTITIGFAKYANQGSIIGVDISADVLQRAKKVVADAGVPSQGPGSVAFVEGNVVEGLAYPDDSFDVVFCSHLFGHMPPPNVPVRALTEIRRILKPGGILATRDAAAQHFYPRSCDLDRLWVRNLTRAVLHGVDGESSGPMMPALFRRAGFDVDNGKVRVGTGTTVTSTPEARQWLASRAAGQLREGDPARQSWLDAGITEAEIEETLSAANKWAATEDAWFATLQCEMLAWK